MASDCCLKLTSDLEVIKLEFPLRLKIKRNDWRKQPIVTLYFEFETLLKLYNLAVSNNIVLHRRVNNVHVPI